MNVGIQPAGEPTGLHLLAPLAKPARLTSVDMLRGSIMIIMALDHVRDFVHFYLADPANMQGTWPALFYTRWITHFCAPLFMFLAGIGAYLSLSRGRSRGDLARFLLTRGLFLALSDTFIINTAWSFGFSPLPLWGVTLWALGWSMIALAGLIYLPRPLLIGVSATMVLLHNTLDGFHAASWGHWQWIWGVLHEPGMYGSNPPIIFILYPLIPWIGVMALGYAFGPLLKLQERTRKRTLFLIGASITTAFVILRWTNLYGDPQPWHHYPSLSFTVISFLNCQKYPPSLLYLMMTIGPGIMILPALESVRNRLGKWVLVYGRVPLFFYFIHFYVIHLIAIGISYAAGRWVPWRAAFLMRTPPSNFGFSLWVVYAVWISVVLLMYPLCRWYAGVKQRRSDWWLSYI